MKNTFLVLSILFIIGLSGVANAQKSNQQTNSIQPEQRRDTIITITVEQQPHFPGGQAAMMTFIEKNINYPADARDKKIEGLVVVQFIVGRKGEMKDIKIVKSQFPSLDAEALRIVKSMPKWIPGRQNRQVVEAPYTLPIRFTLSNPSKKN